MQKGLEGNCGFSYYTCSTSSLESVFMKIFHKAEQEEIDALSQFNNNQISKLQQIIIAILKVILKMAR